MPARDFVQYITAIITAVTILVLWLMAQRQVLSPRYVILPILVSLQLLAFYIVVFITDPPPTETVTAWSAIIRLETGVAFLVVLIAYWKNHTKT